MPIKIKVWCKIWKWNWMRKILEFLWSFFMFLFLSKLQCAFVWDICNPLKTCKTIYHFEFVIWMFNVSFSLWINWKKVCHMEALMCKVVCNGNFWITTMGWYNNQQNCRQFKYFDSKPPHIYLLGQFSLKTSTQKTTI
jgi:hypothetical protein